MENRIPKTGDIIHPESDEREEVIIEIGREIVDGEHIGREVATENGWWDCFWSDKKQRFQYFTDTYEATFN